MYNMKSEAFKGKNALIIGGTSSIGLKVASLLYQNGCNVTVAGRHKPQECQEDIYNVLLFDFDTEGFTIFERDDFKQAISQCDILINCYGPFIQKPLHETSVKEWQLISNSNYAFAGALASCCLKSMMNRNWGRIILFGGTRTESVKGFKSNACYAGAKTGIAVLVKSISQEYEAYGIKCHGIFPGFTRNAPSNTTIIQPEVIADKIVYLLEQDELNGVLLNIDRGWVPVL